jgi:LysR family transcriptional activator of nhaA
MDWLNYHHLYYFWAVVRHGGLSAASSRLRLAPSTVSSQLGKLEETMGGKLFHRVGRNLEPTDLGRLVFRYADEIFSIGREMMDTVHGRTAAGSLSLRVGVLDVLPKLIASKLLEPALNLSVPVRLICLEDKEEALLAELAVHNIDVVLSDSPIRSGLNVKAYSHLLGESGSVFFAAKKFADTLSADFPQSLDGAPMLLPMELTALRRSLDQWFNLLGIKPVIAGEFDDSALMKVLGQEGHGVFVSPKVIESEVLRQYQVQVVGHADAVKERFYAISIERVIKHPAVVAITDAARQKLFVGNKEPSRRHIKI